MVDFQFVNVEPIDLNYCKNWLEGICEIELKTLGQLTLIIGTDDWLLEYNKKHLNHNYYTDVITFNYCEDNYISGDVLISIDRVNENAISYNVSRETELNRVIVHGLLHLLGYNDKTESQLKKMREKENTYLTYLDKQDSL